MFEVSENGEEKPTAFRGPRGKSFQPPELHRGQPYLATKVDCWCLGWSTFYLLSALPLFLKAEQEDSE